MHFSRQLAVVATLLATCLTAVPAAAEVREWASSNGKFTIQAELLGVEGDTAVLRREKDGEELRVPLDKLSRADSRLAVTLSRKMIAEKKRKAATILPRYFAATEAADK